ncbi:MAG: hypothetical protein KGY45_03760 [Hadesarchaea archaeon]|nr:hypothetical protein [Hadesarchaea archaeon]
MTELKSIAEYIKNNYSNARKIVEVGIGELDTTIKSLRNLLSDCELIAVDIKETSISVPGIDFVQDDITNPNLSIYRGSDLIYSIRTPQELQSHLMKVSGKVESDLLIKPLSSEENPEFGELVNYKGATFRIIKNKERNNLP